MGAKLHEDEMLKRSAELLSSLFVYPALTKMPRHAHIEQIKFRGLADNRALLSFFVRRDISA